jgi:hypothetical protein
MAPPNSTPEEPTVADLPVADQPPEDQVRNMATPEDLTEAEQEEETA